MTDPDFGRIEWKRGGWTGQVDLWDYPGVQLLLDADENGPSSEQRSFFHTLRGNPDRIQERIEESIRRHAVQTPGLMVSATQPIKLTSLFLPKHAGLETWRVWYEMEGEEIFWFGAEVSKADEITPFAED